MRSSCADTPVSVDSIAEAHGRAPYPEEHLLVWVTHKLVAPHSPAPRIILRPLLEVVRQFAGMMRGLTSHPDRRASWDELDNKLRAFSLFQYVHSALGMSPNLSFSLPQLVTKASAFHPSLSIWALEGLGYYYANVRAAGGTIPDGLLRGGVLEELPAASLLPLHAGMGLSFAMALLDPISKDPFQVSEQIGKFEVLCRRNSAAGYSGIAFEGLGLVARTLYPQLISSIDRCLDDWEELQSHFWHGVGRGIYFVPANSLPSRSAPWKALEMCRHEALHALGGRNAVAGLAMALSLTNMLQPQIMSTFLRHHGNRMAESRAFTSGVFSAAVIWQDATGDDHSLAAFRDYALNCPLWFRFVRQSCDDALAHHSALAKRRQLDRLWRYHDFVR